MPSSPAQSRAGPGVVSVAARCSAASISAVRAWAGATSMAAAMRRVGAGQVSRRRSRSAASGEARDLARTMRRPVRPRGGRGPRRAACSRSRAAARQAAGDRPAAASGLQQGEQRDGRKFLGDGAGEQAQEHGGGRFGQGLAGAVVRHHAVAGSSAATRPASSRSGVTSAARAPGVSRASRSTRAMAAASSCWSAGARRLMPSRGCGGSPRQACRELAGSRARPSVRSVRRHGRWRLEQPGLRSPLVAPRPDRRRRRPACGWGVFDSFQVASSIVVSTAGSNTRPLGRRATTRSKRVTAWMPAVTPATRICSAAGSVPRRRPGRSAARPGGRRGSSGRSRRGARARRR